MAELLVDTDVFVDHLLGASELRPRPTDRLHYSSITRAELFAGPQEQLATVASLLAPWNEIAVDRPLAELAGAIRREAGILLPDALIAATALARSLTLLTRNARHFERVEGLALRSA